MITEWETMTAILENIVMIMNFMTFKPISVSPYVLWLISTYSYPKVKLSFITIALNKFSFVKHVTILTAGNYHKSNTYASLM
jgi:hypothetical protein